MTTSSRRLAAALTAVGIFALDRWSKWMIETRFSLDDVHTVIPGFFHLVRSENPGIAFGLFAEGAGGKYHTVTLVVFSVLAILILASMLWRIDGQDTPTASGLSLIFGGAVGNVYDRVVAGSVTDFLDFQFGSYHWYTFNIADSAICVGAGLLLIGMFSAQTHREAKA